MNTNKPARWFRMYAEFASDPKLQMLSECYQRRYLMLLCLRCSNGDVTLQDVEVAFQLRIDVTEWDKTKAIFVEKNLINKNNQPTAWEKRQFASDSSAERVAAYRARKKDECNVTVTPPEKEKEKEKETKKEKEVKAIRATALCPQDVDFSVWEDWKQLRKSKRATVSETVVEQARKEATKANMSLNSFLKEWCLRGSQGLKAEWIKEKPQPGQQLTAYQQSVKSAGISIFGNLEEQYAERNITPVAGRLGSKDI
jgi:hypothetical protein